MQKIKQSKIGLLIVLVLSILPFQLFAQMFSVKSNQKEEFNNESLVHFNFGVKLAKFSYDGSLINNPTPAFEFNEPTYFAEAVLANVVLQVDIGRKLGKQSDSQFFRFGIQFQNNYRLLTAKWIQLNIPIIITTDSFTITTDKIVVQGSNRYEQTGFSFGTGLNSTLLVLNDNRIELSQQAHYGYASRGLGGKAGSRTFYQSNIKYISPKIINQVRLLLTAGYQFQEFDLDETNYDYTFKGLNFGLGVAF